MVFQCRNWNNVGAIALHIDLKNSKRMVRPSWNARLCDSRVLTFVLYTNMPHAHLMFRWVMGSFKKSLSVYWHIASMYMQTEVPKLHQKNNSVLNFPADICGSIWKKRKPAIKLIFRRAWMHTHSTCQYTCTDEICQFLYLVSPFNSITSTRMRF